MERATVSDAGAGMSSRCAETPTREVLALLLSLGACSSDFEQALTTEQLYSGLDLVPTLGSAYRCVYDPMGPLDVSPCSEIRAYLRGVTGSGTVDAALYLTDSTGVDAVAVLDAISVDFAGTQWVSRPMTSQVTT